jgi:hypothetical protein
LQIKRQAPKYVSSASIGYYFCNHEIEQLSLEKEEQERQELRKLLMGGSEDDKGDGKKKDANGKKDHNAGMDDDSSMQAFSSQPG